jgi:hypothetical protein
MRLSVGVTPKIRTRFVQDPNPRRAGAKNRLLNADELDGRTRARRAYDAIVSGIESDLGGAGQLSTVERTLVAAYAGVAVQNADLNARLLRGETIDLVEFASMIAAMVRIASRLGIGRRPRNIDHDLTGYLAQQTSPDASDGVSSDLDSPPGS